MTQKLFDENASEINSFLYLKEIKVAELDKKRKKKKLEPIITAVYVPDVKPNPTSLKKFLLQCM